MSFKSFKKRRIIIKSPKTIWTTDKKELHRASIGKLCPSCKGTNIKYMGSNPDGINMNNCYDCLDCKAQWEGY